ncbi:hypothetical protein ACHAWF_016381, partial [Thalassiosira exigua]
EGEDGAAELADKDHGSIADLVLEASLDKTGELEELVKSRYDASALKRGYAEEISKWRSRPKRGQTVEDLLPQEDYPNSFGYRFGLIAGRRIKLIQRNAVTFTRIFIAIIFGLVIGSLFANTPNNLGGALAKNGYIFLHCFIVLMLSAAVTLPSCFRERATLFKHRSAEFYDAKSSYIALLLTDAPLSILEACILAVVSYFWVGMRNGVGNFFYFLGMLIALECAGQALGRLLCALYRKQVTANSISSVIILVFGTVGGFMPSYMSIPPVLRWLSWITPVAFAFEGLMLNEFHNLPFESVLFAGGKTGDNDSPAPVDIGEYRCWEVYFAVCVIPTMIHMLCCATLGFICIEKTRSWYHHQIRRPQSTVKKSFGMGSNRPMGKRSNRPSSDVEQDEEDELSPWPTSLIAKNISYVVPLKAKSTGINIRKMIRKVTVKLAGKKVSPSTHGHEDRDEPHERSRTTNVFLDRNHIQLLDHIDVHFRKGRITCLMGTSGAGKTTLLDVIAGYKTGGTITGDILIDGRPKDPATWKKISGYAEQQDILNPYLSVLETLRFTANCRLPKNANKEKVIQQVIKLMDLEDWSDYIIGREKDGEGLPKHARKRVTIAVELGKGWNGPELLSLLRNNPHWILSASAVSLPKILFLDEPTTGLGTNAAALVMNAVRQATDAMGLITVATIHQPSKSIFDAFDDVLLLTKGGKLCYMGESGYPLMTHFQNLTEKAVPEQCNLADFCLAVIGAMDPRMAQAAFDSSDVNKALVKGIHDEIDRSRCTEPPSIGSERPNSAFSELWLLTKRQALVQWRNPSYCFMRMASSIIMSLFLGILFFGNKSQLQGAVFSIGAIFFLVFVLGALFYTSRCVVTAFFNMLCSIFCMRFLPLVIPMQATVVPLVEDRAVLYRETVSGSYSRLSYGIGQLIADQPFHAVNCLLMFICFYFLVGFSLIGGEIGYFILMLFLSNWVIQSMGQLYALATPNEESANGLGGLSVMLSVILMGFLITYAAMPDGWKWAYWANLFHYILQGLVTNELAGSDYHLDVGKILEGVNVDRLFAFDGDNVTEKEQLSSIFELVAEAPDGSNPNNMKLPSLIECTLTRGCFADQNETLSAGFIDCYLFSGFLSDPPCHSEFSSVLETVNLTEIAKCILPGNVEVGVQWSSPEIEPFEVKESLPTNIRRPSVPGDTSENPIPDKDKDGSLDFVLCLVGALLPQDAKNEIMDIVSTLSGVAGFVFDVIDNGIYIPGELILYVFGWAEYKQGEGFVAPFKWYYCMFAVAVFLVAIEMFKLLALRFIVWTKR